MDNADTLPAAPQEKKLQNRVSGDRQDHERNREQQQQQQQQQKPIQPNAYQQEYRTNNEVPSRLLSSGNLSSEQFPTTDPSVLNIRRHKSYRSGRSPSGRKGSASTVGSSFQMTQTNPASPQNLQYNIGDNSELSLRIITSLVTPGAASASSAVPAPAPAILSPAATAFSQNSAPHSQNLRGSTIYSLAPERVPKDASLVRLQNGVRKSTAPDISYPSANAMSSRQHGQWKSSGRGSDNAVDLSIRLSRFKNLRQIHHITLMFHVFDLFVDFFLSTLYIIEIQSVYIFFQEDLKAAAARSASARGRKMDITPSPGSESGPSLIEMAKDSDLDSGAAAHSLSADSSINPALSLMFPNWWLVISRPVPIYYLALVFSVLSIISVILRFFVLRRALNLFNLLDVVISCPFVILVFVGAEYSSRQLYVPYFLRAFAIITRIQRVLRSPFERALLLEVRDLLIEKFLILLTTLLVIIYVSFCMFHVVEFVHKLEPYSVIDTTYFIVVTLTTVGYGDITPTSPVSRVIVVLTIVISFLVIPALVGSLFSTWNESRGFSNAYRRPFFSRKQHVVVIGGDLTNPVLVTDILLAFIKNERALLQRRVLSLRIGFLKPKTTVIVFLSQRPLSKSVKALLKIPLYSSRTCFLVGSALNAVDLERAAIRDAKAVFLLSNRAVACDDERNVLRLWSVLDSVNSSGIPGVVNITDVGGVQAASFAGASIDNSSYMPQHSDKNSNKSLKAYIVTNSLDFANFHANAVTGSLCTTEIGLALVGSSCVIRGVSTFVSNLISPVPPLTKDSSSYPLWLTQYADGALQELLCLPCPPCLKGYTFLDMAIFLYMKYNVLLMGARVYVPSAIEVNFFLNKTDFSNVNNGKPTRTAGRANDFSTSESRPMSSSSFAPLANGSKYESTENESEFLPAASECPGKYTLLLNPSTLIFGGSELLVLISHGHDPLDQISQLNQNELAKLVQEYRMKTGLNVREPGEGYHDEVSRQASVKSVLQIVNSRDENIVTKESARGVENYSEADLSSYPGHSGLVEDGFSSGVKGYSSNSSSPHGRSGTIPNTEGHIVAIMRKRSKRDKRPSQDKIHHHRRRSQLHSEADTGDHLKKNMQNREIYPKNGHQQHPQQQHYASGSDISISEPAIHVPQAKLVLLNSAKNLRNHVVVFTKRWDLVRFIGAQRGDNVVPELKREILIVSPRPPKRREYAPLLVFTGVFFMLGSPRSQQDLQRACVLGAARIVILNSPENGVLSSASYEQHRSSDQQRRNSNGKLGFNEKSSTPRNAETPSASFGQNFGQYSSSPLKKNDPGRKSQKGASQITSLQDEALKNKNKYISADGDEAEDNIKIGAKKNGIAPNQDYAIKNGNFDYDSDGDGDGDEDAEDDEDDDDDQQDAENENVGDGYTEDSSDAPRESFADLNTILARHAVVDGMKKLNMEPVFTIVTLRERNAIKFLGPSAGPNNAFAVPPRRAGTFDVAAKIFATVGETAAKVRDGVAGERGDGSNSTRNNISGRNLLFKNGAASSAHTAKDPRQQASPTVSASIGYKGDSITLASTEDEQKWRFFGDADVAACDVHYHPLYAAGAVYAESMMDTIVFHEFFKPVVLDVVRGLAGLQNLDRSSSSANRKRILKGCSEEERINGLCALDVPVAMHGSRYDDLVAELATVHGMLAIGLYRAVHPALQNTSSYVYTNPHPGVRVLATDIVYVLTGAPVDEADVKRFV